MSESGFTPRGSESQCPHLLLWRLPPGGHRGTRCAPDSARNESRVTPEEHSPRGRRLNSISTSASPGFESKLGHLWAGRCPSETWCPGTGGAGATCDGHDPSLQNHGEVCVTGLRAQGHWSQAG